MTKKTLFTVSINFLKELITASKGKQSSLSFIKNPLPQKPLVSKEELFQVMVIGGSVFKSALVKPTAGKIIITSQKETNLPLLENKKKLFFLIENHLDNKINLLALNFAFPLQPQLRENFLDGQLLKGTKEHQLKNLSHQFVGQEIEKYIFQKHKRRIKTLVANDSICLLLSGLSKSPWLNLVAGVVGTGTNFAFFVDKKTAVNLESGNFNRFPQTKTGKTIDRLSTNPGKQLFEKEVAGAYLFRHYQIIKSKKTNNLPQSTLDLNYLAYQDDRLAQKLFERSSALIASQIAGIYFFKKHYLKTDSIDSHQFQLPLTFVMEGSVFWQGWQYKSNVLKYLSLMGIKKQNISFIKIENSDLIGALKLIKISVKMI